MASLTFEGKAINTVGEPPKVGDKLSDFTVVGTDLEEATLADFRGKRLVLNIFPSVDTGVCAAQIRNFNKEAASLENTAVIGVSKDLPFAQSRFCGAEGIDHVRTYSAFRSNFGQDYGIQLADGPLAGLLARAVIVADEGGIVRYVELVPEVTSEPDYEAALAVM